MTSNMIRWTESIHHNGVRLEHTEVRHERAVSAFARAGAELQNLVDQAVAAGASARELAGMPAFRAGLARAGAFGGELQLTTALLRL